MRPAVQRAVRMWGRVPLPVGPAVMVLGYHRIRDAADGMSVRVPTFAGQMRLLAGWGRERPVVGLDDALARLEGGGRPHRSVVLTFDDAWEDNHRNALPILSAGRLPAVLYVPSALLGTGEHMSRAQLLEMVSCGVAVGAHSRTHADLRRCGAADLDAEVRGSREELEDLLGRPVTSFAYPGGRFDSRVAAAVREAGFASAVTTRYGWLRSGSDRHLIARTFVEEVTPPAFAALAGGGATILAAPAAIMSRLCP